MKRLPRIFIILLFFECGFGVARSAAQPSRTPALSDSSAPSLLRNYVGFEVGASYNVFVGAENWYYTVNQPSVNSNSQQIPFQTPGSGVGIVAGGLLDLATSERLSIEGKLRFTVNSVIGNDTRTVTLLNAPPTTAQQTSQHQTTLDYLGLAGLLRYRFNSQNWYLAGGVAIDELISNNVLLAVSIDGSTTRINGIPSPSSQSQSITGSNALANTFNTLKISGLLGIGTSFAVNPAGTILTPELLLNIPFTSLFNSTETSRYAAQNATPPNLWHVTLALGVQFPWGHARAVREIGTPPVHTTAVSKPASLRPMLPAAEPSQPRAFMLRGIVRDAKTRLPLEATLSVVDLRTNTPATDGSTTGGKFSLNVKGAGIYSVTAEAAGYLFGSKLFRVDSLGKMLTLDTEIDLASKENGVTELLVFFDFGKDSLQRASYPELDRAVKLMRSTPYMKARIEGYTDNVGSDLSNRDLSMRRANSVMQYLTEHGVASARLTAHGNGAASPVASNDSDEGRARNRRVEFVIVQ